MEAIRAQDVLTPKGRLDFPLILRRMSRPLKGMEWVDLDMQWQLYMFNNGTPAVSVEPPQLSLGRRRRLSSVRVHGNMCYYRAAICKLGQLGGAWK